MPDEKRKLSKDDKFAIKFIIGLVIAMIAMAFFNGMFERGPFRVTLYSGDKPVREWIVESRPEQEGFGGGGYKIKTKSGETVRVSGNIVIEKYKPADSSTITN